MLTSQKCKHIPLAELKDRDHVLSAPNVLRVKLIMREDSDSSHLIRDTNKDLSCNIIDNEILMNVHSNMLHLLNNKILKCRQIFFKKYPSQNKLTFFNIM